VAELPYQAVGRDPVNLSLCVVTFDVCGAGRLVLLPQADMSLLSRTASEYYMYYTSFSVVFYMFCRLGYKYSIRTPLLVVLDILPIIHTRLIYLCNVLLNSIKTILMLQDNHNWIIMQRIGTGHVQNLQELFTYQIHLCR
jgi:hypothetical protein